MSRWNEIIESFYIGQLPAIVMMSSDEKSLTIDYCIASQGPQHGISLFIAVQLGKHPFVINRRIVSHDIVEQNIKIKRNVN